MQKGIKKLILDNLNICVHLRSYFEVPKQENNLTLRKKLNIKLKFMRDNYCKQELIPVSKVMNFSSYD